MQTKFNHAANDSPRSGSTERVTPVVRGLIVLVFIGAAIWFNAVHP